MKLTKDEARILAHCLLTEKHNLTHRVSATHENALKAIGYFTELENKLWNFSVDKRRQGRRSHNDFDDLLKRFCNPKTKKKDESKADI